MPLLSTCSRASVSRPVARSSSVKADVEIGAPVVLPGVISRTFAALPSPDAERMSTYAVQVGSAAAAGAGAPAGGMGTTMATATTSASSTRSPRERWKETPIPMRDMAQTTPGSRAE